ncbi:MAG: hypothetical protein ACRC5C_03365 [Bacilli bacterium]
MKRRKPGGGKRMLTKEVETLTYEQKKARSLARAEKVQGIRLKVSSTNDGILIMHSESHNEKNLKELFED